MTDRWVIGWMDGQRWTDGELLKIPHTIQEKIQIQICESDNDQRLNWLLFFKALDFIHY